MKSPSAATRGSVMMGFVTMVVTGIVAGIAAWWIVGSLELTGVVAGVVAVVVAMGLGVGGFAVIVRLFGNRRS